MDEMLAVSAQRVQDALAAAGVTARVRELPEAARTAVAAAGALSCEVGAIANSLISPVGHPVPIETVIDEDLQRHEQIWAAAGTPHAVFPTTFDELLKLTGGAAMAVV